MPVATSSATLSHQYPPMKHVSEKHLSSYDRNFDLDQMQHFNRRFLPDQQQLLRKQQMADLTAAFPEKCIF